MTLKTLLTHAIGINQPQFDPLDNATMIPGVNSYNRADYHTPHQGWLHKHGHHSFKSGSALNALTLLAFLFFLNVLQNCLKDNITGPPTPIVVMVSNGDNGDMADMNGTKIVRTKRSINVTQNTHTYRSDSYDEANPINYNIQPTNHYASIDNRINKSTEQQLMDMINNNVNKYWTGVTVNEFKRMPPVNTNTGIKKKQKSIEENFYKVFTYFYGDDEGNKTESLKQSYKPSAKSNETELIIIGKTPGTKKIKRINNKISNVQEPDYDDDVSHNDPNDPSLLSSLMWKAMETFKPGLRESAEDTVCCKLIACESSRLSKKLGGYVKYLMKKYVNKGLEWICKTEEGPIKHAIKIGKEGKSCAEEIEECKPKNFITDFVLFIDYLIV